jgi:hypothetical protein
MYSAQSQRGAAAAKETPMTSTSFVEWSRSDLDAVERGAPLGGLTPAQRHCLLENDYVWLERAGVIWTPPDGQLRRARFTHYANFETRRGPFRIDSEGRVGDTSPPDAPPSPPGA